MAFSSISTRRACSLASRTLQSRVSSRAFRVTPAVASHIGSASIALPDGVEVSMQRKEIDPITKMRMEIDSKRRAKFPIHLTQVATVKGPLGESSFDVADFVNIETLPPAHASDTSKLVVKVQDENHKPQRQMWGTTRSLLNNFVTGVSEGHIAILKFVGTGFRATFEKNPDTGKDRLSLKVGYCVPIPVEIPEGIKVQLPLPHRMVIEGVDKQAVKLLAANIRKHRPPEPYKGKGIFVDGETITRKVRRIK